MVTKFAKALYRRLFGKPEYHRIVPANGRIYSDYLHFCSACNARLVEVRPGKYQCPNCE